MLSLRNVLKNKCAAGVVRHDLDLVQDFGPVGRYMVLIHRHINVDGVV